MSSKTTKYRGHRVAVEMGKYGNGRPALLINLLTGEPYTVATVNLPEVPMAPDEVAVKDYAENEGMLAWLLDQGLVELPTRTVQSGFVMVPICRLRGKRGPDAG